METLSLQAIKREIGNELNCHIVEAKEEMDSFLSVYMGEDYKNRGYWLQVRLMPQVLRDDAAPIEAGYITPAYFSLIYTLEFPFEVKHQAIANAARLVAYLNSSIHLPGFQLNEIEQKISFRHLAIISGDTLHRAPVMAVLGSLFLFKEAYCETLEKVCSGSVSMNEVFAEMAANLKKFEK